MPDQPNLPHICLSCGMCCNGTLFNRTNTRVEEQERLIALGFPLRPSRDAMVFDQPCTKLEGTCCTVYEQRPHACRAFRCALLKAFDDGRLSRLEALERIAAAKQLLERVEPFLLPGETVATARERWKQRLASGDPTEAGESFMLNFLLLGRYLDSHFYRPGEKILESELAEEQDRGPPPKGQAAPPS